jgi:hypothetical protein
MPERCLVFGYRELYFFRNLLKTRVLQSGSLADVGLGRNVLRVVLLRVKLKSSLNLVSSFVTPGKAFQRYVSRGKRFVQATARFYCWWDGLVGLVLSARRGRYLSLHRSGSESNLTCLG